MDFKNGKTLLVVCGILVFCMIYAIGVAWDQFPPPDVLYDRMFGDSYY